jgi:hypothetical protein
VLVGGREINWARSARGGSDKVGGIQMDSLITAAAGALAARALAVGVIPLAH